MKTKTVDGYILSSPKEVQFKLRELRKTIKEVAPLAEERISYGIPYYHLNGRLAYFRCAKNHIGLYIPPPVISNHVSELKDYTIATATIQFPLDKKLPLTLIKKLIRERAKLNKSTLQDR